MNSARFVFAVLCDYFAAFAVPVSLNRKEREELAKKTRRKEGLLNDR